jgi:hypothetical protein
LNPDDGWKAAIHSKMLGTTPGYAYQNRDEIDQQLRARVPDYDSGDLDPTILNDIKVGYEGSIFGLHNREKMPERVRNPGMVDGFISGLAGMVVDSPFMLTGGVAGFFVGGAAGSEVPIAGNITGAGIGAAAGAFAVPAAMREALIQGIQKGDVKDFSDLFRRAGAVTWAATKGAVTGAVTELAGGVPVGGLIAKSAVGSMAVKGLYQATALTTAADLLEGKLPSANDFAANAALIVPLNLITHGLAMRIGEAKQAALDLYAKDGTTPEAMADKLAAQPAVKPDLAPGLRPAIKFEGAVLEADVDEHHADLAERSLGTRPVDLAELETDPARVDEVLRVPEVHDQETIDRAWALKKEAIESGEAKTPTGETLPDAPGKSGRGFVDPNGKFLSREQAAAWSKQNEPDVHEMWTRIAPDSGEFHSEDYSEARERVANRNVAEGEPAYSTMSPAFAKALALPRQTLNKIKAGWEGSKYGKSVIRSLWDGPRKALRAEGAQIADRMRALIPETVDQEALHFMRDYRDDPEALRAAIPEAAKNPKLAPFIPSMERALDPSPQMLEADQELTGYFTKTLERGRQLGILDSSVDPSRYSPRLLMKTMDEAERSGRAGGAKFSAKTPNAIRREYLHALDPLMNEETGIQARTFNALDELSVYADRHSSAVATQIFTMELKNSELGKVGSQDDHPAGWQLLKFPGNLYVPKVIADAMKPILEGGGLPEQLVKWAHFQQFVKALELSLSIFHMKAMTITAMNNMSFADFGRALRSDNASPEFEAIEREGALHGLETTKTSTPYEAYQGLKQSSLPMGKLDTLRNLPLLKQVDQFAQALTRETFDVIQRKFKVMDFAGKQDAWIAKHPEHTDVEYGTAMRGIAKEVNAAYGGLNWDVMGVSKQMRDLSRLLILAPDWTFSNVANLKYAGEGGPAGNAARMFWLKSFTTGIALTAGASLSIGHRYDWDHPFEVYLGDDANGKAMYSNVFFAGAPKDAITLAKRVMKDGLLQGVVGFAANKFGPVAQTGLHIAENKDFRGKPITKPGDTPVEKDVKGAGFAAKELTPVPFGLKDIADQLMDDKQYSKWDYVLPLLGMYATHEGDKGGGEAPKKVLPGSGAKSKKFTIRGAR